MPIESVLYLALVLGAMMTFAGALAYGERVSGRVPKEATSPPAQPTVRALAPSPVDITTYKKAA